MQQAAKYFVFVTASGIIGKIVVSFVAPLIGRRALGILWGFLGAAALALPVPAAAFNIAGGVLGGALGVVLAIAWKPRVFADV